MQQSDGKLSFRQALTKRYGVPGHNDEQSFQEVAATPRVSAASFQPGAPDTRFSFFGLRGQTTTAKELSQHMDLAAA